MQVIGGHRSCIVSLYEIRNGRPAVVGQIGWRAKFGGISIASWEVERENDAYVEEGGGCGDS